MPGAKFKKPFTDVKGFFHAFDKRISHGKVDPVARSDVSTVKVGRSTP